METTDSLIKHVEHLKKQREKNIQSGQGDSK
jgi:hypothetical protein